MAKLLYFPKIKKFFVWGPRNVQSGNPGVVGDDIAVDLLSSQILGVDRIEMEIMFLIGYWPFRGKVNFYKNSVALRPFLGIKYESKNTSKVNYACWTRPPRIDARVVFLQL